MGDLTRCTGRPWKVVLTRTSSRISLLDRASRRKSKFKSVLLFCLLDRLLPGLLLRLRRSFKIDVRLDLLFRTFFRRPLGPRATREVPHTLHGDPKCGLSGPMAPGESGEAGARVPVQCVRDLTRCTGRPWKAVPTRMSSRISLSNGAS